MQQEHLILERHATRPAFIGSALGTKEDELFITGTATYVTDVKLPGMLHAVLVKSLYPRREIKQIKGRQT